MMIAIKAYDHSETTLKQIMEDLDIPVEKEISKLKGAKIVVWHSRDEASWKDLIRYSPAGSIRIRTSSAGRLGHPHYIDPIHGVVVLELQLSHVPEKGGVSLKDWQIIFDRLGESGVAREIINGEIPEVLTKFFGNEIYMYLTALCVLCQGYLMVYGWSERDEVKRAMNKMGCNQSDLSQYTDRRELYENLALSEILLENDVKTIEEKLTGEWRRLTNERELILPDSIANLVKKTTLKMEEDTALRVAKAYLVIAEKLELVNEH